MAWDSSLDWDEPEIHKEESKVESKGESKVESKAESKDESKAESKEIFRHVPFEGYFWSATTKHKNNPGAQEYK